MIKRYTFLFLVLLLLINSPIDFPQGKAANQKPVSTTREKIVYYYDEPVVGKAAAPKEYIHEYLYKKHNETESTFKYDKKDFTNYTSYSLNYFRIDNDDNSLWDGKHWEDNDFPLKVYVKKSSSKYFKEKYLTYIDYAFNVWKAADSRINFEYTESKSSADIIISFETNLMEKYDENYLGLTDYEVGRNTKIEQSSVEIGLLKFDDKKISDGEIKSTIIHELGHALGLGHSSNNADLMYPFINENSSAKLNYIELSTGDIEAIRSVVNLGYKNYSER